MIRKAETDEHEILSRISILSKQYWDYPSHYFDIWQKELTITGQYIKENDVFVIDINAMILGYYSFVTLEEDTYISGIPLAAGLWLEHMFIRPSHIGKGLGRELFHHCLQVAELKGVPSVKILADPNAKGFYLKMGCQCITDYPSTIPGRTTPYLEYSLA